eukprot:CAMPEP_0202703138 /NCGR_PEP_ID=MMETSP1385-20130828/16019_1 /ASSEMBLY_ACC=CAM_ASM_000861 /TAXON_ID=933848 /ORGANISM="Elphidium margaritaceum" /LENGTH=260 /DNA_ID=CAMNT_0049360931 /DNA_START=32 /DNA_END=814 /DNA_ORIENTATION=-
MSSSRSATNIREEKAEQCNQEQQYRPGDIVTVSGLKSAIVLNGMFGVVKRSCSVNNRNRVEVLVAGYSQAVGIKPCNLTIMKPSTVRRFQHAAFWSKVDGKIPMCTFDDWPSNWSESEERRFLRKTLRWKDPQILGGIESEGVAKPNFMMYFDAGDDLSPINEAAASIENLLPGYELGKISGSRIGPIRGICVLVYSPTMSSLTSSFGPAPTGVIISDSRDRLFSLSELRDVLAFQDSPAARAQYKAHDNHMHRMFGGLM